MPVIPLRPIIWPALDHVAHVHVDPAEMPVDGLQSVAVVDHDAVAVDAERSSPNDPAVIRCLDADVLCDGEIVTEVNLLVDLLAVIDIVAHVGKGGFGLGVGLACEGLRPEEVIGGLEA